MISDIKVRVLKNFKDALEKMKTVEGKISNISTLKERIKNSSTSGLKFVKDKTGLNDPDEIKKLVELAKETLDKVNLSLYTLRSVKGSTQDLNNDLDLKDVSKSIFKFVSDQDKLLMLAGEGALAEIENKIKDTHISQKQKEQLTQQKNEIGQSLGSLKKSLDGVGKNEIEKFKTALNDQMNSFYNSASCKNFHLFKVITNVLKTQMEQFKTDIQEILDSIGNDQNKKDIKNLLVGLVFCDECEQFDNFAYNLQHFDQINSDDWNERSMFNMKCDESGKLERSGAGLNNIGATCYMNATLQTLRHLKSFNKAFKNYGTQQKSLSRATAKIDMTHEMIEVVKNLDDERLKVYSPNVFKEKLSEANPLFKGIAANDSKDLINFLIEDMHVKNNQTRLSEKTVISIQQQTDENFVRKFFQGEMYNQYNSFVSDAIYGLQETHSICSGCSCNRYNFQAYSFLEFPLEQVNAYVAQNGSRLFVNPDGSNPDVDLDECFEYFKKIDLMTGENQMYCNSCNDLCDNRYRCLLETLPNDLIINLNRGRGAVYECKVNFPDYFDCYKSGTRVGKFRFKSLNSIICHIGPSSMSGHFIAYAHSIYDGKWYKYNDAIVTKMSDDIFNSIRSNSMPYILFYQGMDGKGMLNTVLSKVTDPTLKSEIQESFGKLADAVEHQERLAYLLMCAAESNLGKDKKPTLHPAEISHLICLAYDMIKDRNDLSDDNRRKLYENAIDTFIATRDNLLNKFIIVPLMKNANQFEENGNLQQANLLKSYARAIDAKFNEIVLKRPQDMHMFVNLLQCAASYTSLSVYNWSSFVCAVYEIIKSDTKLSDTVLVKYWNNSSGSGTWVYHHPLGVNCNIYNNQPD